jgi:hypothetical protein
VIAFFFIEILNATKHALLKCLEGDLSPGAARFAFIQAASHTAHSDLTSAMAWSGIAASTRETQFTKVHLYFVIPALRKYLSIRH